MNQKICVIGLGYIGLPTALVFSRSGSPVVGVDVDERKVEALKKGEIPIEEQGLEDLLKDAIDRASFVAQTHPEEADVYIITVPTPLNRDQSADLSYVISAIQSIKPYLKKYNIVIVESTIPPRTMDDMIAPLLAEEGWNVGEDIYLSHCPERVLPGNILNELVENNRIIGGINKISAEKSAEIYRSFVKGELVLTSAASAEMAKLMENTYRDVNIALSNELAKISSSIGVDALEVIKLANKHPRVQLHSPGPGVGGHCIPIDPYFIIEKAPGLALLMDTARLVNNKMPDFVVNQVEKIMSSQSGRKIAVFGITYKGNVDDVRESPALEIIQLLEVKGYEVYAHDPYVRQGITPFKLYSKEEAVTGANCLLILSDHDQFKILDDHLLDAMKSPVIFDTKNCVMSANNAELLNYGNLHELSQASSACEKLAIKRSM